MFARRLVFALLALTRRCCVAVDDNLADLED